MNCFTQCDSNLLQLLGGNYGEEPKWGSNEVVLHQTMETKCMISILRISIKLTEVCTSEQCDENLANSAAARKFIEDMELSMVNQEHMRLKVLLLRLCRLHCYFS